LGSAGLREHPAVGALRGLGLFRGVEFVRDRRTGEPFPAGAHFAGVVVRECVARNVWI
jgi:4-aminobutyrate aminotransferase-like enzyme